MTARFLIAFHAHCIYDQQQNTTARALLLFQIRAVALEDSRSGRIRSLSVRGWSPPGHRGGDELALRSQVRSRHSRRCAGGAGSRSATSRNASRRSWECQTCRVCSSSGPDPGHIWGPRSICRIFGRFPRILRSNLWDTRHRSRSSSLSTRRRPVSEGASRLRPPSCTMLKLRSITALNCPKGMS